LLLAGAILLWATAAFAQQTNLIGLSPDNGWSDFCVFGPGNQVYTVYVYILNPVNPDFQGGSNPVSWINGFECRVWVEGGAILLGWHFPVNAIDAGTNGNTVVGFAEPVPVVDGRAIVATLDIFLEYPGAVQVDPQGSPLPCDGATAYVFMAPTRPTSSIDGRMAFLDADDPDNPLVAADLDDYWTEDIALLMEARPVDVDQQTWGGIKALYR
jgi:hypothetical protein